MTALDLAFRIEQLETVTSTQTALLERLLAEDDIHGLVVRARSQTGAYGRQQDAWQAGAGGSYQSLGIRDGGPTRLQVPLSALAIGVGIAQAFREYGAQVDVKWPNDLCYKRKKLGGILCQYRNRHLLVGVGVNVDNEIPAGAVGLRGWDLDAVHASVLRGVQRGLETLLAGLSLADRFAPLDALAGSHVTVSVPGGSTVVGTAAGITDEGALVLDTRRGRQELFEGHVAEIVWRRPP